MNDKELDILDAHKRGQCLDGCFFDPPHGRDLNLEHAEAEHAAHEVGECQKDCPWCLELEEIGINKQQDKAMRFAFDRIFGRLK